MTQLPYPMNTHRVIDDCAIYQYKFTIYMAVLPLISKETV